MFLEYVSLEHLYFVNHTGYWERYKRKNKIMTGKSIKSVKENNKTV